MASGIQEFTWPDPTFIESNFPRKSLPVSPYPLNLGGAISTPKFWGGVSKTPCFTVFSGKFAPYN